MGEIVNECEHGLTRRFCPHCETVDRREARFASMVRHPSNQPTPIAIGPWSTARYAFDCPVCAELIDEGETVYRRDTLEGEVWVCPVCVDDIDGQNDGGDAA